MTMAVVGERGPVAFLARRACVRVRSYCCRFRYVLRVGGTLSDNGTKNIGKQKMCARNASLENSLVVRYAWY